MKKEKRVEAMQRVTAARMQIDARKNPKSNDIESNIDSKVYSVGGVEKSDEILSWQLLHRPNAPVTE